MGSFDTQSRICGCGMSPHRAVASKPHARTSAIVKQKGCACGKKKSKRGGSGVLRRRVVVLFSLLFLLSAASLSGASPADAGYRSARAYSPVRYGVWVDIAAYGSPGPVYGEVYYKTPFASDPLPWTTRMQVYVLQCDGLGHNCGAIAANGTQQLGATYIRTSNKVYSPGHVYKTCASVTDTDGWRLINYCTAFTT
jgi:hypothetical protein